MAEKKRVVRRKSGGTPLVAVSKAAPIPNQIGNTGLNRDSFYVNEEFLNELHGQNGIRAFREMRDNDPIVGSVFFAIEMFMRRVKWDIDAFDDSPEAEANAEFLRECREDMSMTWADFICEIMTMMQYGWSAFEPLYKYRKGPDGEHKSKHDDNKIGWRKFDPRSQDSFERWEWDDEGGLAGFWQRPAPTYDLFFLPIERLLMFRTDSRKNNPEGRSVLRNAYRPYYFKKRIEEIEGVGVERDLAGLPFAQLPAEMLLPDASDNDKATVQSVIELLKNVRRDQQEGVLWPQAWDENGNEQYKFSLMNSGGSRQFSTDQIITRYEQRIAMTVLADFILLGNDSAGSFAMSTTKTGMFQAALGAWLDMIQDVLNNIEIPRLMKLNGIKDKHPTFRHAEVQAPSIADLSVFVAALTGAGAQLFPDVELENHFRRLAQMPEREANDDAKSKEDELRDEKMLAEIEGAKAAKEGAPLGLESQKQGIEGQKAANQQIGQEPVVSGKQPDTKKGAPTATTGKVKSKLPPRNRRTTKKDVAANNTKA